MARDFSSPRIGKQQRRENPEEGALSPAIRSQQAEKLSPPDFQRDAVERPALAECFHQFADNDGVT